MIGGRGVDLGHGSLVQVAAVGDLPLVVGGVYAAPIPFGGKMILPRTQTHDHLGARGQPRKPSRIAAILERTQVDRSGDLSDALV